MTTSQQLTIADRTESALHHCHLQIDAWFPIASADLSPEAYMASDIMEAYSQAAIRYAGTLDDARYAR